MLGRGGSFVLTRIAKFVGSDFLEDMAQFFVEFNEVMGGFRQDLKRKILGSNAHIVVDKVDVLEDSRSSDAAQYTIRSNRVGQLDQGGQYRAEQGSFETQVTLAREDGEWRIDELPSGVVMDRTQFLTS